MTVSTSESRGHATLPENSGLLPSWREWVTAPNQKGFECLGVLFVSVEKMEHDINRGIGAVSALMLHYTVVVKSSRFTGQSTVCSNSLFLQSSYFSLKSPIKEILGPCFPPPPPYSFSILQCLSVRGEITIRRLSSVNHSNGGGRGREKEDKRVNDFHLIAPPTLLESGKGWRAEDERERERVQITTSHSAFNTHLW